MEVDDRLAELNPKTRTCVVLGGRGFIGRSVVLRLLKLGKWIVRIADSSPSLQLDPSERHSLLSEALSSNRASYYHVNVCDMSLLLRATQGSSAVFYIDEPDYYKDDFYQCYMSIVQGAKNVLAACRECKVRRLIYNSSADVVFDGSHDVNNADESLSYPRKFEDMISNLKSQAEALILFANDIDGLLTCAIRPCYVFGPGDTHLIQFVTKLAKSGWAKFIVGSGENMADFTYVENVAHAYICLEEALDLRTASVAGKAFFISNLAPMKFWDFVSQILDCLGYQRPLIKLPTRLVLHIIFFIKWLQDNSGINFIKYDYYMLVHHIQLASCTRTFDCTAAQKHIGYSPVVSQDIISIFFLGKEALRFPLSVEALTQTIKSFSNFSNDISLSRYRDIEKPSKVDRLLGNGKVAHILLWRDEKKSFSYFFALVLLFYWFFLCGRTFASSIANLLLLLLLSVYLCGLLPWNMFGFNIKRLSFEIPKVVVIGPVTTIAHLWNGWFNYIRSLAQGQGWKIFFQVVASIHLLKLILLHYLTVFLGIALVFVFTAFFVYEQYEYEIDGLVKLLGRKLKVLMELLVRSLPPSVASILSNSGSLQRNKGRAAVKHRK